MKRFLMFSLLLFMTAFLAFPDNQANAATDKSNNIDNNISIDDSLIKLGFPQRLIDTLTHEDKLYITTSGAIEYVNGSITNYDSEGNVLSVDDFSSNEPIIEPFGTISSTNMSVSQYALRFPTSSNREIFELSAHYVWKQSPFWTLTDMIGFAWDGNKFNAIPNTSLVQYRSGGKATYSSSNLYSTSFTGVGWTFPQKFITYQQRSAYAKIRIQETKGMSGQSQFHSIYVHSKGSGSLSLNFGIANVSFSGSRSNDQRASYINFSH